MTLFEPSSGDGARAGRVAELDLPPRFRVEDRPERDVVRVCPVGEVDLATVDGVRAHIVELRDAGFTRIVLDLREVTFLASAGLRLMLEARRAAQADGWEFAVIDGSSGVQRLLDATGLRSMIDFVDPSGREARRWR